MIVVTVHLTRPCQFCGKTKKSFFFFFLGCVLARQSSPVVLLLFPVAVVVASLALVDTPAVQSAAVALTVSEAADAAMADESRVGLLLSADALVGVVAVLTRLWLIVLAVVAMAVLIVAVVRELIAAVRADEAALELVARERHLLTVEARLGCSRAVLAEESLDAHEPLVDLIGAGRESRALPADEALKALLKVGLPRVPAADVAVRFRILCACHLVLLGACAE